MPIFKVKATTLDGKTFDGEKEAVDKFALYKDLHKENLTLVSATEVKKSNFLSFNISFFGGVKTSDKIFFAKNLASMIEAGLSLSRALAIMEHQTRSTRLKQILQSLIDSVSKGTTLSESMKNYPKVFSSLFVSMTKAGEESGNLSQSLKIVGSQLEKTNNLKKKIRGAMIYPIIILTLMVAIGILALTFIVPTLTATFTGLGVELPLSTKALIFMSDFLVNHFILVITLLLVLIAGFITALKSKPGKRAFDFTILHIPLINKIVKEINSARTARTLSSLLSSGVDMIVAIEITGEVLQNSYYKNVLAIAQEKVKKGEPLSDLFNQYENLYPILVAEMISVGEETGKLSEMLLNLANFYEEEVEQKTKDMSTVIEPFMMILVGIGVGFFAISMLAPTYSLVDVI